MKTIRITMEDVAFIFNDKLSGFNHLIAHSFCSQCKNKYTTTIINYNIVLNELFDLELQGNCLDCGNAIGRYIETGDDAATAKNAEAIWRTSKALKELKIKKQK